MTAFNVWARGVGFEEIALAPEPAVAADPIESIEHGKFCNLMRPFVSMHLKISADAGGAIRNNAIKRLSDLLIRKLLTQKLLA
jgi:hypothetical protein